MGKLRIILFWLAMSGITFLLIAFSNWFLSSLTYKKTLTQSDALVLLAGNLETRTPAAAALFHQKRASGVLLTNDGVLRGWSRKHQRNLYAIEQAEELLLQANIPASAIIKLPFYRSGTVHDARAVRRYLQKNPMKSILLVTSDFHANRALWIFKQVLKDLPVSIAVAPVTSGWSSAVPIMLEPLKTVYYRVRFGLLEKP